MIKTRVYWSAKQMIENTAFACEPGLAVRGWGSRTLNIGQCGVCNECVEGPGRGEPEGAEAV